MLVSPSRRGGIAFILIIIVVAGIAVFMYSRQAGKSPAAQARARQKDPEAALRFYAQTAYAFIHNEPGGKFNDVELTVTQDDYRWFHDNYQNLHVDSFNILGGIDPTSGEAIARRGVLMALLQSGPLGSSFEIKDRQIGDREATFTVSYLNYSEDIEERKVKLVKEGKAWKMSDFAGARQLVEGLEIERTVVPRHDPFATEDEMSADIADEEAYDDAATGVSPAAMPSDAAAAPALPAAQPAAAPTGGLAPLVEPPSS